MIQPDANADSPNEVSASALATDESKSSEDVGDLIERLREPTVFVTGGCQNCDESLKEEAASTLSRLRGERDEALANGGWELPEIEQDEDGSLTLRVFHVGKRRAVSFTFNADHILRIESDLDGKHQSSDRWPHLYPTASEAARLKAEDLNRKLVEGLRELEHAVIDARQILQKTFEEWSAEGQWSAWDATTINNLAVAQMKAVALLSSISGGEAAGEDGP